MNYKALICDCDGTIVGHNSLLPTITVKEALKKAGERLYVSIATGRPLVEATEVFDYLDLSVPCIITGGAQVVDPQTRKILWEKSISKEDAEKIFSIVDTLQLSKSLVVNNGIENLTDTRSLGDDRIYKILIRLLTKETAEILLHQLSFLPEVIAHLSPSRIDGRYYFDITHTEATKQHGIFELSKILGIETHEMIGIGDGGNDFPLLMACGLKIAMGNASEELKTMAL